MLIFFITSKKNIKSPVFDLTRHHHLQPSGDYLHIDFYGKSRTIHAVRTPTHICFCSQNCFNISKKSPQNIKI